MKKRIHFISWIFAFLFFVPSLSAQVQMSATASQIEGNAIQVDWFVPQGVEVDWSFELSRAYQGELTVLGTIPSEGFGQQNYSFIDYGPFVNGAAYTYNVTLFDSFGEPITTVSVDIILIENPHFISGKIAYDEDDDCNISTDETPLYGLIVEASNGTNTYYGSTNFDGEYKITVSGNTSYIVSFLDAPTYWESCVGPTLIDATSPGNSTIDFPLQATTDCPYLVVDISAWLLRRCMTNQYIVHYSNSGTVTAEDPYIEITFDPFLTVVGSSIPWTTTTGNTYTFEVDPLEVGAGGSFSIDVDLDCDVELGQTHCTTAHIFPDSICTEPSPDWDGSSIEVSAECTDDDVIFTIKNIGDMNMTEALDYVIIQDNVMLLHDNFQLNAGQSTTETLMATGNTFRMEAEQAIGHPGFSMPSVAIEGCGGLNTGFITLFGENDGDPFVSTDCQENVDSYDPNDKQGFPTGYGEPNYIETGQDLEYLIRFQNTGTAPAINVTIVDTLDRNLDLSTFQPGASSHPYRYEFYGNGAVQFIYENINLPDSTANEPASHGFIKFTIKQQPDLPLETEVFNRAAIYFDFNPPVLTNTTFHTIGVEFITVNIDHPVAPLLQTKVYPNPFVDKAIFELEGLNSTTTNFRLYNGLGQLLQQETFSGNKYEFERGLLPAGLYLFEMINEGLKVSSGKVIVK